MNRIDFVFWNEIVGPNSLPLACLMHTLRAVGAHSFITGVETGGCAHPAIPRRRVVEIGIGQNPSKNQKISVDQLEASG